MNKMSTIFSIYFLLLFSLAYSKISELSYTIDLKNAKQNIFIVNLQFTSDKNGVEDFYISKWTPGYYQILDFDKNVKNIECFTDDKKKEFTKLNDNTWRISVSKNEKIKMRYEVIAQSKFIAKPYINEEYAFIRPTGIFIFPDIKENTHIKVSFQNNPWNDVATGLAKNNSYLQANNIDELLDSPILIGNLDKLNTFQIKEKNHYFLGRELNDFDTKDFIENVKKIVSTATNLMQDIPYNDYTFISIGKGNGGIEQTNSTALTFNGELYKTYEGKQKLLNFITHEYFHHFNVKRIRPIELGPFNYSGINRTSSLWVSEGLTVYYEGIIMNRAGIKSREQLIKDWSKMINMYENNEGKNYQSLANSSLHTWEDGPFGIKGKTISFYEKGPLIGMLLDIKIRNNSNNQYSLDDVMRKLYKLYYKKMNRGFTESEIRKICEEYSNEDLSEIFSYIYNLEPIDYNKYLNLAGLNLNFSSKEGKIIYELRILENQNPLQTKINKDLFREIQ